MFDRIRPPHTVTGWAMSLVALAALLAGAAQSAAPTAEDLLACTQNNLSSFPFHGVMEIETFRPEFSRAFVIEVWSAANNERAMMRVLEPADEAGSGYLLASRDELWFYTPAAGTAIPLPSASLSEAFFGTDASVEDLYRGTLTQTFTAQLLGTRTEGPDTIHRLRLVPGDEADVVYGKLELEVRGGDCALLRVDYYDQRNTLIRESLFSDFVTQDGVVFARRTVSNDLLRDGAFTRQFLRSFEINVEIPEARFSLDCLKDDAQCG